MNSLTHYESVQKELQHLAQKRETWPPPGARPGGGSSQMSIWWPGLDQWETARLTPKEPYGATALWAHHRHWG